MEDMRSHKRGELTAETKYEILLEISQKVRGTLDLDVTLNNLLDAVRTVLDYDAAGIFVLNREDLPTPEQSTGGMIASMATRGFDPQLPEGDPMLHFGKGICGYVIKTGDNLIVPDVRKDPRYVPGRLKTLSEIAVPIIVNDQVIGALDVESDRLAAFGEWDVEVLRFFADAAAISIEKAMLHQQLLEKRRMENQLNIAHEVLTHLLPPRSPDVLGYDIAGLCIPTWRIGGDYFDFIPFSNHRLGAIIADVAGKGIPAALIMATFRAVIRTQICSDMELKHILHDINMLLKDSLGLNGFVTSVYSILDPKTGSLKYTNCGHNPPILIRVDGRKEELTTGGPPLGVFEDSIHEIGETMLDQGDLLLLYTDGVIETTGKDGSEFGVEKLEEIIRSNRSLAASDMINEVVQATQRFSGSDTFLDDFTLMIIKRK